MHPIQRPSEINRAASSSSWAHACPGLGWPRFGLGRSGHRASRSVWVLAWLAWLVGLSLLACVQEARADFPVARVKRVVPPVEASREGSVFGPLRARAALYWNTSIRTGSTGAADILFSNGTLVAMKRRSRLQIERPGSPSSPLVLRVVGAFSEVFVRPHGNTIVRTGAAIAAARGTEFLVRLLDENTTQVVVTEGSVDFSNPFGAVVIQAGQASDAHVGQAPSPPRAVDVTGQLQWTASVTGLPLELPLGNASPPLRAALLETDEQAQRQALQVLAAAPGAQSSPALSALGLLELRAGNAEQATQYLRNAIEHDAAASTPHALLSIVLLSQNQIARALEQARNGVQLAERNQGLASRSERSLAHTALAHALFFANRSDEALRESGRAVALAGGESDPLSPLALLVQGRVLLARNHPDQALEAFAQAAALAPNLFLAQREVGASYAQRGQLPRAAKALRHAIELRPDDAQAHALLGDVLAREGQHAESRREFDRALALEPGNALSRALLAQSLLEEGQLKEARAQLEQVNTHDPDAGLALVRLSEEALYRQDLGAALEFGQRGVEVLPRSSRSHYQLGRVLWEQGRIASAEAQFRQAVTLDPNFDEARYALGLARERTESGLLTALSSVNGAGQRTVGSAGSALTLQNLQTPGADDRVQALAGDPTAVRPATRAFGDFQFDGALGSERKDAGASYLRLSGDRLGILGLNAERQDDNGARANADRTFDRGGLLLGRKSNTNPSGGFLQGEFEHQNQGVDTLFEESAASRSLRFRYNLPRLLAGYNFQSSADARTRILLQTQKLDQTESNLLNPVFDFRVNDRSLNFELRHDQRLSQRNQLTAGLALGRRTRNTNSVVPLLPNQPPSVSNGGVQVRQAQAWVRDTFALSPRLSLAGEMRVLNLDYNSAFSSTIPGLPPFSRQEQARFTTGVPLFIASYQLDERSALRLRARRLLPTVRDFELLLPNDPFALSSEDLPGAFALGIGAQGRSTELEYDRSFSNSSLLRLTLFQQDFRNANITNTGVGPLPQERTRALRATYETSLGRDLSLFSALDLVSAKDQHFNERVALVPRATVVGGLQYLNLRGYFADLTGAYVSETTFLALDPAIYNYVGQRRGGFGTVSARIGKRSGLKSSVYIEALNLLDKKYPLLDQLQPGRQIRVGLLARF